MIRGVCLLKLSVNTHLLPQGGSSCKAPHITHLTTSGIRLEKCFVTTKLHLTFHQHGGRDDDRIFMFRVNCIFKLGSELIINRQKMITVPSLASSWWEVGLWHNHRVRHFHPATPSNSKQQTAFKGQSTAEEKHTHLYINSDWVMKTHSFVIAWILVALLDQK